MFFIYLVLFCWLLTKIKFIKGCGINEKTIIILFLIRILFGVINGYINLYHYSGTDAETFHHDGITEYHLLFNNPREYFSNIFRTNNNFSGFLEIKDSFWNNLRTSLIIKLLSIFNIFSRGNFFINTIFYNFFVFFGSVALYKTFINIFADKKIILILCLFLLPSTLYFTAGIQKDGLIFLAIAISTYNLFYLIKERKFLLKRLLWIIIAFIIILLLRNFVFIALIPAIVAWVIAEKNKRFIISVFLIVYGFFIILFFWTGSLSPRLDLPEYVSERQIAFIEIAKGGNSSININPLFPDFRSFLNNAPQAINHSLMRPYLTEKFNLLYIPVAIEIFIYELVFLLFLFYRSKNKSSEPFIYFVIFFSLTMFLMIGYTVPIMGAIVRYRSIYLPLLLIPVMCGIDWDLLKSHLHIKK